MVSHKVVLVRRLCERNPKHRTSRDKPKERQKTTAFATYCAPKGLSASQNRVQDIRFQGSQSKEHRDNRHKEKSDHTFSCPGKQVGRQKKITTREKGKRFACVCPPVRAHLRPQNACSRPLASPHIVSSSLALGLIKPLRQTTRVGGHLHHAIGSNGEPSWRASCARYCAVCECAAPRVCEVVVCVLGACSPLLARLFPLECGDQFHLSSPKIRREEENRRKTTPSVFAFLSLFRAPKNDTVRLHPPFWLRAFPCALCGSSWCFPFVAAFSWLTEAWFSKPLSSEKRLTSRMFHLIEKKEVNKQTKEQKNTKCDVAVFRTHTHKTISKKFITRRRPKKKNQICLQVSF